MPTAKPRVNVSLDDDDYALLTAFAASQGVSRSSVLAELWKTAAPVMARVLKLVQEAQKAKESVKKGIFEAAVEAESKLQPLHREALLNLDMFEEAVKGALLEAAGCDEAAGDAHSAAADGAAQVGQPPSSNTGVRFRKGRGVSAPKEGG